MQGPIEGARFTSFAGVLVLAGALALTGCAAVIGAATMGGKIAGSQAVIEAAVQTARTVAAARGQGAELNVAVAGEAVSGRLGEGDHTLADGSYFDTWFYEGIAGETIHIELRTVDFEPYLVVGKMVGGIEGTFERIELADDEGQAMSRTSLTLPATGTYAILANALQPGSGGAYTLLVQSDRPADTDEEAS